jgi:hypothetical protein
MVFHFPLHNLTHDLYNMVAWHFLLLLPQWCLILPLHGRVTRHGEMQIQLRHFFNMGLRKLARRVFFSSLSFGD